MRLPPRSAALVRPGLRAPPPHGQPTALAPLENPTIDGAPTLCRPAPASRRGLLVARPLTYIPLAACLLATTTAHAAVGLRMGFFDVAFSEPQRGVALDRARVVGGRIARINIGWPAMRPPDHARSPSDPAYDFRDADA